MFPRDGAAYRDYRAAKLDGYPTSVADILVDIDRLQALDSAARNGILARCERANMAIYNCHDATVSRDSVRALGAQFGLHRLDHHLCSNDDGVSEVTVAPGGVRGGYVPYSDHSLSWHTDGYYNEDARQVRAVVLHCEHDAATGGENALRDPEIAYIRLRDADSAFIEAFEHPQCMTIPANHTASGNIRPISVGPVFSYDSNDGALHMRYSARKKNIRWRDDAATTAARECLADLLDDADGPVLHYRLQPGQGLISNNVLHNRTAFADGPAHRRLLYRARFFDHIHTS